jgi:hypothetical protein
VIEDLDPKTHGPIAALFMAALVVLGAIWRRAVLAVARIHGGREGRRNAGGDHAAVLDKLGAIDLAMREHREEARAANDGLRREIAANRAFVEGEVRGMRAAMDDIRKDVGNIGQRTARIEGRLESKGGHGGGKHVA